MRAVQNTEFAQGISETEIGVWVSEICPRATCDVLNYNSMGTHIKKNDDEHDNLSYHGCEHCLLCCFPCIISMRHLLSQLDLSIYQSSSSSSRQKRPPPGPAPQVGRRGASNRLRRARHRLHRVGASQYDAPNGVSGPATRVAAARLVPASQRQEPHRPLLATAGRQSGRKQ